MTSESKIRVLMLDDERLVRMSFVAKLRNTDFDITDVSTPEEAVALLRSECFQVVVSDVLMGTVDGFMFRDIVRGMNRTIPIIFFTSLVNEEDNLLLARVLEDSYSYYLPKNSPTPTIISRMEQAVRSCRVEAALENMRRDVDSSMDLAAKVQISMSPPFANMSRKLFYAAYSRPYSKVTGDLYECIPIGQDAALFVFGDISGHGVSASLAMAAVQSYLRQMADYSDLRARNVARIATQIGNFIYHNLSGVAYMTGLVVYYNSSEGRVRMFNAGHPDLRCYERSGRRVEINPEHRGGLPLGMLPDTEYGEDGVVDVQVPRDSLFFAYSDGLIDLSTDPRGEQRVPEALLDELFRETVKGLSESNGITEIALAHQVAAILEDYGYVHAQDDQSLIVFGCPQHERDLCWEEVIMTRTRIDVAVRQIGECLTSHSVPGDVVARSELLLGEFLMNLHDHGYELATRHKELALVEVWLQKDEVALAIWHRARPVDYFVHGQSPDAALDLANSHLSEHGRGIPIIRKIATASTIRSYAGLTVSTFYIPLSGGGTVNATVKGDCACCTSSPRP